MGSENSVHSCRDIIHLARSNRRLRGKKIQCMNIFYRINIVASQGLEEDSPYENDFNKNYAVLGPKRNVKYL